MRKHLPRKLEKRILVMNKHCCCICENDGMFKEVVIHHIDGDNSNNEIENLAVLCLQHASMADTGLKRGKLGSGKKLTPSEVREYKKHWETKVGIEKKFQRRQFPLYQRKHFEILYEFEIAKIKNEILSLNDNDKRLREKFDYLDQLVIEEFISGLELRKLLLEAYGDIALQSINGDKVPKMLSKAILGLFKHLIGPHEVKIQARDKKLILKSIEPLGTLGSFSAEFNPDLRVLLNACNAFYELSEIAKWYKLKAVKEKIVKELIKIREDCSQYESEKKSVRIKNERLKRVDIVKRIIKKVRLL
jgi:hypothetical protein